MIAQVRVTRRQHGPTAFLRWRQPLGEIRMKPGEMPFTRNALVDMIDGRIMLELTSLSNADVETIW
jgi:hypothetical protein